MARWNNPDDFANAESPPPGTFTYHRHALNTPPAVHGGRLSIVAGNGPTSQTQHAGVVCEKDESRRHAARDSVVSHPSYHHYVSSPSPSPTASSPVALSLPPPAHFDAEKQAHLAHWARAQSVSSHTTRPISTIRYSALPDPYDDERGSPDHINAICLLVCRARDLPCTAAAC